MAIANYDAWIDTDGNVCDRSGKQVPSLPTAEEFAALQALVSGGGVGKLYLAINNASLVAQSLAAGGTTKLTTSLSNVITNVGSCWDNTTKRFTPTVAGTYLIFASVQAGSASNSLQVQIRKNGSTDSSGDYSGAVIFPTSFLTVPVDANGTDYFELYVYSEVLSTVHTIASSAVLKAVYLGAGA